MLRRSRFNPIRGAGVAFEEAITSTEQQGCVDRVCMVVVQVCIEIEAREEVRCAQTCEAHDLRKKAQDVVRLQLNLQRCSCDCAAHFNTSRHVTTYAHENKRTCALAPSPFLKIFLNFECFEYN